MAEDLESSTKAAWEEFERRLVTRLEAMEEDDLLLVEVPGDDEQDGATPYVQFCAWGEEMLRCEAVSNHYLAPTWALSDEAGGELVTLGFTAPTHSPDETADDGSANYYVDVPRDEAFDLGWMTVVALRDVYGVPHPMLLDADGVVDPPPLDDERSTDDGHECDPEAPTVHLASGPDELQQLVDAAMERKLGHPPHKDSDGDIPISTDDSMVWVCVNGLAPVVDVWGVAYADITDRGLALHELAVLNRDHDDVKFVLRGDCIVGQVRINALPFVGAHLHRAVDTVCSAVDRAKADLTPRFQAASNGDEDGE